MREVPALRDASGPPREVPKIRGARVADRYVMKAELASGGMGVVYHVFDRVAGQERALKRIKPNQQDRPFFQEAFEREYQVLAGLDHPRIIRVFDYGVDEHGPYYTMELLQGGDLRAAAPLPFREACGYLRDVATSLALLHARRLIHRDLSPANIRRTPDGHCKLFDFGALTGFGYAREIVGTAPAVPPEAIETGNLDHRADLYQLGALAYWLLTGSHAYPATSIDALSEIWESPPLPPSELVPGVPPELDLLVLSLLSHEPLARPASAAEVISRLEGIAELAPENERDRELFAQSFFLNPRFVGRDALLKEMAERAARASQGRGSAVLIEAAAGMGRTRLLEELAVRAQIAGASVVRVDASAVRNTRGTLRALSARLLDALPAGARHEARGYRSALVALGPEVEARLGGSSSTTPAAGFSDGAPDALLLEQWFATVSQHKTLLIQVDNVEDADDASLGVLAGLAKLSSEHPLMLVFAHRRDESASERVGLTALRNHCHPHTLTGLSAEETLELSRSLFGDAPNVARFADWLYARTAGSPLYCVELSRQLFDQGAIRYAGGLWILPLERPDAALPAALEGALQARLSRLSHAARSLAECLSLQRERPTLELCRLLTEDAEARESDDRTALALLDELARNDVLHADEAGYRFSSTALRDAVLEGLDEEGRRRRHARLGEAFTRLSGDNPAALQLSAGFHLIRGGDELRGADMIAKVASDSVTVRTLIANLHHAGPALEAALKVYKRYRCTIYQRAPLLATLAHAGYYEDRTWADRYGDEALDTLEHVTGLRLSRLLARFVGRGLGLFLALSIALLRFWLVPKRERPYSFKELMVQVLGAVTTLTGTAILGLDVERAARVAATLEPFSVLPERTTPVGIYQFCRGLELLGRDHHAHAFSVFDGLVKRFEDPRYYRSLPPDARRLYVTASHFARGVFAAYHVDARPALESAAVLDASGLKLYAMIASTLRFLYFLSRGEFASAAAHRAQVELHAAHVGSAWQVELWEPAALLPVYTMLQDLVALTRLRDRLETSSKQVPALHVYERLTTAALLLLRGHSSYERSLDAVKDLLGRRQRSFVGWTAMHGFWARALNEQGLHDKAQAVCEAALRQLGPQDRSFVTLCLGPELQLARAEAGLGAPERGLDRLEGLLQLHADSKHPLLLGTLYEMRAQIAWACGRRELYEQSLAETERWFRATGTPALIAKCERLAELSAGPRAHRTSGIGWSAPSSPEQSETPTIAAPRAGLRRKD